MSSSPFTSQGILVGDVVFDLVSILFRWVLVAFLSDLSLRFFFKRRIGLYLVVQTSVLAGMHAWKANYWHHSATNRIKLQTCFLFLAAFAMTRGVDLLLSSLLSILRHNQAYQVAFVATAVTDTPSSFQTTSSSNAPGSIDRIRVYQALHDITKNVNLSGTWPESIGDLSDAEVAAVTLAGGGRPCMGVPFANQVGTPSSIAISHGLTMPHSIMMPLFGESVQFAELYITHRFQHPHDQISKNGLELAYGYTIPISTAYYIPRDGRSVASKLSRRQFGVVSMPNNTLGSYDMECGLDMVGLSKWLVERLSQVGTGGARLQYDDIHDHTQRGVTLATITFSKNPQKEVEVLSFGASFSKPAPSSAYLKTASSSKVTKPKSAITTSFPITSESDTSRLVLFPWWLLIAVLTAGLSVITFGWWGDLAEIVATILYSFTFRPVPPAITSEMQEQAQPTPQGAPPPIALSQIPLNQCTQFALVQIEGDDHGSHNPPAAPLEIRLVPNAWKVKKGDNVSAMGAGNETVLAVGNSFVRLVADARATQADWNTQVPIGSGRFIGAGTAGS